MVLNLPEQEGSLREFEYFHGRNNYVDLNGLQKNMIYKQNMTKATDILWHVDVLKFYMTDTIFFTDLVKPV
jgi:hypothetical protein